MDRRSFVRAAAVLGLLSVPSAAIAQQARKVYRIGVLGASPAAEHASRMEVFRQALRDLGWVNERAIAFDERWADLHYERLPTLAAELVALKVDLIFAEGGTPAVEAAMKATRAIPIVFPNIGDPMAQKIVQSMAHPGGNVTGLSNMSGEVNAKRLALLKETVPEVKRVALLVNGANLSTPETLQALRTASGPLGMQVEGFDIRRAEDVEKSFVEMSRWGLQAILVTSDVTLEANLGQIGRLALKHRLPVIAATKEVGVLATFTRDISATYRRAAAYVDKILRGAYPGDLPIEQPTTFVLTIDLGTAKALGIKIPQAVLLRADEVIQ